MMAELNQLFDKAKGATPLMDNSEINELLNSPSVKELPKLKFNKQGLPKQPLIQFVKQLFMLSSIIVGLTSLLFMPTNHANSEKKALIETSNLEVIIKEDKPQVSLPENKECPRIFNETSTEAKPEIKVPQKEEQTSTAIAKVNSPVKEDQKKVQKSFKPKVYATNEIWIKDPSNNHSMKISSAFFNPALATPITFSQLQNLGFQFFENALVVNNINKDGQPFKYIYGPGHYGNNLLRPNRPIFTIIDSLSTPTYHDFQIVATTNGFGDYLSVSIFPTKHILKYMEPLPDSLICLKLEGDIEKYIVPSLQERLHKKPPYFLWFTYTPELKQILTDNKVDIAFDIIKKSFPEKKTNSKHNNSFQNLAGKKYSTRDTIKPSFEIIQSTPQTLTNLGYQRDTFGRLVIPFENNKTTINGEYGLRYKEVENIILTELKGVMRGIFEKNDSALQNAIEPFYITHPNGNNAVPLPPNPEFFHIKVDTNKYKTEFSAEKIKELVAVQVNIDYLNMYKGQNYYTADSLSKLPGTEKSYPLYLWYEPTEAFLSCLSDSLADEIRQEYKSNVLMEIPEDNQSHTCKFFTSFCSTVPNMSEMTLFPNPADNILNARITFTDKLDLSICIVTLDGKVLQTEEPLALSGEGEQLKEMDISRLMPGMYLVMVKDTNGAFQSQKFIKK